MEEKSKEKSKYGQYFEVKDGELICKIGDCDYKTTCNNDSSVQKKRHLEKSAREDHKQALADVQKKPVLKRASKRKADEQENSGETSSKIPRSLQAISSSYFADYSNGDMTDKIDQTIAEMIASDGLPLQLVDKPGFRRLMQLVAPQYKMKGRKQFTERILPEIYEKMMTKVKSMVSEVPYMSVTMDTWSSAQHKHSLLSLTVHYLDESMLPRCAILGARPIEGRHTAENLQALADACLDNYGIPKNKIHMMTRDAASTMRRMAKDMEVASVDCFAHKVDVSVKEALKQTLESADGVIEKVKKFVRKIRKSRNDSQAFEEHQQLLNLPETTLVKDVHVRWNSTFNMLHRFLTNRTAIETFLLQKRDPKYPKFEPGDWQLINALTDVLGPIAAQYELLQNRSTSVAYIYPVYKLICLKLEQSKSELSSKIKEELDDRMSQFDAKTKRYLKIATALETKLDTRIVGNVPYVKWVVAEILEIVDEPEEVIGVLPESEPVASNDPFAELYDTKDSTNEVLVSKLSLKSKITEEVIAFFNEKCKCGSLDLDSFWDSRRSVMFPRVKLISRKFLSAQATSAESERLFSAAGLTCSDLRKRLTPSNLEKLIFLHQNLLLFNFEY